MYKNRGYFYKSLGTVSPLRAGTEDSWSGGGPDESLSNAIPDGRFKKVIRKQKETTRGKSEMEKSLSALSVDNSLLDPIHRFSNSNSGKFSTHHTHTYARVSTYSIANKQTGRPRYRPSLATVRNSLPRTYTNP